jgi:hypothetical protein
MAHVMQLKNSVNFATQNIFIWQHKNGSLSKVVFV